MRAILPTILAVATLAAATLFAPAPVVFAAPEPSAVPTRWELDLEPGPLRIGTVDVEGVGPRTFFYMTYKVANNTSEDLYFAPIFELCTDDGASRRAGQDVPLQVTDALLARLNNPFLLDQISVIGNLSRGEENAREGLVVWPAENLKVDEVVVYCGGFSGETRRIVKPASSSEGGEPEEVVLRKTMMLVHPTPGDLAGRGNRPLERSVARWILR